MKQRRKRVVVVSTSFPRDEHDASGHFVLAHAEQLCRDGWDVTVIAGGSGPMERRQANLVVHWAGGGELFGWPGVVARLRKQPLRARRTFEFAWGVRSLLRKLGPFDYAVGHFIIPSAWPLLATIECPLEVVAHGGDMRLLTALPAPLRHLILRQLLARDTKLFFVSRQLRARLTQRCPNDLARALVDASEIRPPAVHMPIRRLAAAYPSKAPPEPFALLCGRLVDAKRYHLAIEAAAERQIPVTVIGDGPAEASLRKLADTLGVEATFLGRLPRPEALAVMDRATVLLHPSQDEAAPTVVLEARALGTPVVCCDAGDLKLWARRDDGIFLCHPEPSALAAGIDGARQASDKKRTTDHPSPVG